MPKELNFDEIAEAYVNAKDAHAASLLVNAAAVKHANELSTSVAQLASTLVTMSKVDAAGKVYRINGRAFLVRQGYQPTEIQIVTVGS